MHSKKKREVRENVQPAERENENQRPLLPVRDVRLVDQPHREQPQDKVHYHIDARHCKLEASLVEAPVECTEFPDSVRMDTATTANTTISFARPGTMPPTAAITASRTPKGVRFPSLIRCTRSYVRPAGGDGGAAEQPRSKGRCGVQCGDPCDGFNCMSKTARGRQTEDEEEDRHFSEAEAEDVEKLADEEILL